MTAGSTSQKQIKTEESNKETDAISEQTESVNCEQCGYPGVTSQDLREHMRINHKSSVNMFPCTFYFFTAKYNQLALDHHVNQMHRDAAYEIVRDESKQTFPTEYFELNEEKKYPDLQVVIFLLFQKSPFFFCSSKKITIF